MDSLSPIPAPVSTLRDAGDPFALRAARVHEAQGRGRRAFALFQAARHPGPLIWIVPSHVPEMPMLRGLPKGVGERLHVLRPVGEADLLWCAEETLRAAPIGLVIAEPQQPLSLIAGRRLQLAAAAGATTGLMLIGQDAGSNAAQTRWQCAPVAATAGRSTLHRWEAIKNKSGTSGNWILDWHGTSDTFDMVPALRERYAPAPSPG